MAEPYVFISYSRQDRAFVEELTTHLREAGVETWTDLENIPPGADWANEIVRGLMGAAAFVYVASQHSRESKWMDKEIDAFVSRGGRQIDWPSCWGIWRRKLRLTNPSKKQYSDDALGS